MFEFARTPGVWPVGRRSRHPARPRSRLDDNPEVFVLGGNTCLSGAVGSCVWLFYEALTSKNLGYPDLKFGGPGFCSAVCRWDGKAYGFLRNQPEEPGGCDDVGQ